MNGPAFTSSGKLPLAALLILALTACSGAPPQASLAAPAISYSPASHLLTAGVAATPIDPTSSGGPVALWGLAPALPAGLSLDTGTGRISGTPLAPNPPTTYTVTATNTAGSATALLSITVDAALPAVGYRQPAYVFVVGSPAAVVSPVSRGGAVVSWSIAPALPAGLSFDTGTGQLSGTPAATSPATVHTVTAINNTGSATAQLTVTVNPAGPAFTYPQGSYVFTAGAAISAIGPTSTGGAVSSWSVSPALPAGLSLDARTGQITGTPSGPSAAATYTVSATNVTGTVTAALSVVVNPAAPAFAYPQSAYVFALNTAVTGVVPASTGGAVASWSISPALPAGLSFSGSTGQLSGAATAARAAASYTVTATNVTASTTATLSIGVKPAAPAFTYPQAALVFNPGIAIAPFSPVSTGGAVDTWTVSPALPAGLSLDAGSGQLTGTPTGPSPAATYTVTGTNLTSSAAFALSILVQWQQLPLYESGWSAPWGPYNWGTVSENAAAPVPAGHGGTAALQVTYTQAYTAVGVGLPFYPPADPPQLNEVKTIEFDVWFVPGATAPDPLLLTLNDAGLADQPPLVSLIPGWGAMTSAQRFGKWHHVSVEVASLHPVRQDVNDILLFNNSGNTGIQLYLASVHLGYQDRTTPPALALAGAQLDPTYRNLSIQFTSDESMLFHVDYGTSAYTKTVQGPASYGLEGSATLAGLTPGTTVQYRIVATDHRIDPAASPNQGTLTGTYLVPQAPTEKPTLSSLAMSNLTGGAATVSWTTDRPCTAVLNYQRAGGPALTRQLATLSSSPSVTLDLLEPSKQYSLGVTVTDAFALTNATSTTFTTGATSTPTVTITVSPGTTHPISPYVYGNNYNLPPSTQVTSGLVYDTPARNLTLDRWGGNRWTTYNWENNASNAGSDYLYESDSYLQGTLTTANGTPQGLVAADQAAGMASLITVPLQGYVAADVAGPVARPFPNLARFKQLVFAKGAAFTTTPATSDNFVYADESVWALQQKLPGIFAANAALPTFLSLDNEPDLWASTHEEVQGATLPTPAAFIQRSAALAQALRGVAPAAKIFGPAISGWYGLEVWGDGTTGYSIGHWFIDDYLAGMKSASATHGGRLLDVLDFHWYSQVTTAGGKTVSQLSGANLADDEIQTIVQQPRSLWDHSYVENSWIARDVVGGPIYVLDRIQASIDANYPGTPMAITEYDNGGYHHIAGAIAQADNLGIFGSKGLFAATYWSEDGTTNVNPAAFVLAGFKAYRDFDGNKASFGDTSIAATSSDTSKVAAYVSADSKTAGRYVIVAINRSSASQDVAFNGLSATGTAYVYRLDGNADPVNPAPVAVGQVPVSLSGWVATLPAYSVNTIEIR